MTESEFELLRRAARFWRTRNAPTYLGLRRMALVAEQTPSTGIESSQLVRKMRSMPFAVRSFPMFKDFSSSGKAQYRRCMALSPWTSFVEAVSMAEVASAATVTSECVYSHQFAPVGTQHVFGYFVDAFQQRIHDVTAAVAMAPDSSVVVADIKSFYPSISHDVISHAVDVIAARLRDPKSVAPLFLNRFAESCSDGLPVGPATSHVLANEILREFDDAMALAYPRRYFRYVDDIIVVCKSSAAAAVAADIRQRLATLSLEVQSEKTAILSGKSWNIAQPTLLDSIEWHHQKATFATFLSAGEACLFAGHPSQRLEAALVANGISAMQLFRRRAQTPSALQTIRGRIKALFERGRGDCSPRDVAELGVALRDAYLERVQALSGASADDPIINRWRIQRSLRLAGRLALLMPPNELSKVTNYLPDQDNTKPLREIVRALEEGRPGLVLPFAGGATRQLSFLWGARGNSPAIAPVSIRTPEYLEAALELVAGGALAPEAVELTQVEERRLADALLRPLMQRSNPDLSYDDEIESLFLNVPVWKRFPFDAGSGGEDEPMS